jgi:Polymer-forming cytoskeletal
MRTRSPSSEPQPLEPARTSASRNARPVEAGAKSVIGNDLKIIGQGLKIISQGTLQVDGEVEGDVGGAEVIIGEQGKVTGTVAAERVIVHRAWKATSITCPSPSSRAPSSTADAGEPPTRRHSGRI